MRNGEPAQPLKSTLKRKCPGCPPLPSLSGPPRRRSLPEGPIFGNRVRLADVYTT